MTCDLRSIIKCWKREVRYFLFPESRLLAQRTAEIDQEIASFKRQKALTRQIVDNANQPDVLRNLVIAMSHDGKRARDG